MQAQDNPNSPEINPKNLKIIKVITISIGLSIGILFCEIFTRVYYYGVDAFSPTKVNSFIPVGVSGFLSAAENDNVLYELKPNIDAYFKLKKFNTNSQGNRDKEYSINKPKNTIRGLVIGDSFTMGSGVEIEDVYHSVVEKSLNKQQDSINYELINFGVGGYNMLNYLGVLENKTLKYNPDFIIIGYCAFNDYFLPSEKHYKGDYNVKIKKVNKPFYSIHLAGLIERTFSTTTNKKMFEIQPEQIAFIDQMFKEYSKFSIDNDIPIIISVLSVLPDNGNLAVFQEMANKHGIGIIDSFDQIDQENFSSYIISKLDHHPNAKANKIFANNILNFDRFQEIIKEKKKEVLEKQ